MARAVEGVSCSLFDRQTLAIVGESGCGKSVTSMSIMRLLQVPPARYAGGRVLYKGQDLLTASEKEMQKIRGGEIAMIFQEPMTSLNPVFTIGDQILEAVLLHQKVQPYAGDSDCSRMRCIAWASQSRGGACPSIHTRCPAG